MEAVPVKVTLSLNSVLLNIFLLSDRCSLKKDGFKNYVL
jgi:hypothetical protein